MVSHRSWTSVLHEDLSVLYLCADMWRLSSATWQCNTVFWQLATIRFPGRNWNALLQRWDLRTQVARYYIVLDTTLYLDNTTKHVFVSKTTITTILILILLLPPPPPPPSKTNHNKSRNQYTSVLLKHVAHDCKHNWYRAMTEAVAYLDPLQGSSKKEQRARVRQGSLAVPTAAWWTQTKQQF